MEKLEFTGEDAALITEAGMDSKTLESLAEERLGSPPEADKGEKKIEKSP